MWNNGSGVSFSMPYAEIEATKQLEIQLFDRYHTVSNKSLSQVVAHIILKQWNYELLSMWYEASRGAEHL